MTTGNWVGGIVGAIIGWLYPPLGIVMGAMIGMGIGGLIDSPDTPPLGQAQTSELDVTTANEWIIIPDILGTTKLTGNILWYGNDHVEEVIEEVEGGSGGSQTVVTGYRYYLTWAMGLCLGPVDMLYAVYRQDKVVWEGELPRPPSFGVETIELEDMGEMMFYFGTDDQTANSVMGELLGSIYNVPYRNQCYAFFNDCHIGGVNRVPIMRFIVGKRPTLGFSDKEQIEVYEYNPAHAIWYTLENSAGFPSSFLHEESFAEGAQTLWEEGRGVSILMGRQQDALAYTESILNHIGGILRYGNDSKVHLKLLRADKNASELPAINEDILVDVPAIRRKSWVDTINEVKVKYSKRDFSGDWMMSHRIGFNEFIKKDPDYHITTVDYNQVVFDHLSCSGANEQNDTYLITSVPMELYEDFGFNIDIVVNNITIISGSGNVAVLWGVSTYEGAFRVNFGDAIALIAGETYLYPGTSSWIKLQEVRDGSMPSGGSDTYDTGTDGGSYALYLTILRTYTGGYNGYGYIECEIYTDSARTVKVHTLRVDLHKAVHYTYLWGLSNIYNYGTNRWADGSVLFLKFKTKGGIDYKESNVSIVDNANREIVGKTNSKAIQCALFQNARNAHWAGDRFLKQNSFPMAEISFPANRKVFRYEPGDLFRFTYSPYGITDMVCRVISIKEESVESEVITINAIEDVEYVSQATLDTGSEGKGKKIDYQVVALTHVEIVESPFVVSGDSVSIIPLATREKGIEIGYLTYMSVDGGASYLQVDIVTPFNPYGTLVSAYSSDTFQIDDETGFEIDFTNSDVNQIQTTTREQLFTGKNLALLGDEILSFQTIEPVDGFDNRYKLSGIYRGRFDTLRKTHNAGEDFYYIGTTNYKEIKHNELIVGASRKFKLVPYSTGDVGSISEATELSLTVGGRGKKPYMPGNLMANGEAFKPRYSTDITLTWSPRKRSDGAGIGNADTVVDAAPAWEGDFEVEVWVDTVKVRTTSVINDDEWTYTQAMNIADNGSLADLVTFKLFNYIETGGIKYESDKTEITVKKE